MTITSRLGKTLACGLHLEMLQTSYSRRPSRGYCMSAEKFGRRSERWLSSAHDWKTIRPLKPCFRSAKAANVLCTSLEGIAHRYSSLRRIPAKSYPLQVALVGAMTNQFTRKSEQNSRGFDRFNHFTEQTNASVVKKPIRKVPVRNRC